MFDILLKKAAVVLISDIILSVRHRIVIIFSKAGLLSRVYVEYDSVVTFALKTFIPIFAPAEDVK